MNFKLAQILSDIRNNTLTHNSTVYAMNHKEFIYSNKYEMWIIPINYINEIEDHFPYDGYKEFLAWLNHKTKNSELEKEIQRYLNLKSFI